MSIYLRGGGTATCRAKDKISYSTRKSPSYEENTTVAAAAAAAAPQLARPAARRASPSILYSPFRGMLQRRYTPFRGMLQRRKMTI